MTRYKVYDIITFIRGGDKMKSQYNKTITACFVGYIVQAVVNNFTPLLFLFVFSEMLSYSNFPNYIVSDF